MNTFWLKLAGVAVGVVIVLIIIGSMTSSESGSPPSESEQTFVTETNNFYSQAEQDKEKLLAEPEPVKTKPQPATPPVAVAPAPQPPTPAPPPSPTIIYVKSLSEIDKMEAERLLNIAVPGRSIGRLPMTGYNLMVQNCKQIIERWPESWYAFRAKQMLTEMVETRPNYRQRYKITDELINVSMFYEQRRGTKAIQID